MKKSVIRSICAGLVVASVWGVTFASAGDVLNGETAWGTNFELLDGIHLNEEYKNDGYMVGKGNEFKPDDTLTRAEFATILDRLFAFDNVKETKTFKDIQNHWAKSSIEKLASVGVINGVSDTEFNPNGNLQLDHVLIMLSRILDMTDYEGGSYYGEDIVGDHYAKDTLQKLVNTEIWVYYDTGRMPNIQDIVDRGEITAVLNQMLYGNTRNSVRQSNLDYLKENNLLTDVVTHDDHQASILVSLDMSAIKGE